MTWLTSSRQNFVAIDGAGKLWEWPAQGPDAAKPELIGTSKTYRRASVGALHYCGVDDAGGVDCWGSQQNLGLLGTGAKTGTAPANKPLQAIAAGVASLCGNTSHNCALLADGSASCWGYNKNGLLGDGTLDDKYKPSPVKGLTGAKALACGFGTSCALRDDGTASCWGSNLYGEVGNGKTGLQPEADPVPGLGDLVTVDNNSWVGCAMRADRSVACWGSVYGGRLALGAEAIDPWIPRAHAQTYTHLCDAYGVVGCAIDAQGAIWLWGNNEQFGLSDWGPKARLHLAEKTPWSITASSASVAYRSGCAITTDGLSCWGDNEYGKVTGKAPYGKVGKATLLPGTKGAKAVHTTIFSTCYIGADSKMRCLGSQKDGMLGNGKATPASLGPTLVQGLLGGVADDLAGGHTHTCALAGGKSHCWGMGHGAKASPTPGGHLWQTIDGGFYQTCAIEKGSKDVYCWCLGSADCTKKVPQVGVSATLVKIAGLANVTAIASGPSPNYAANCAVVGNDVFCWGKEVLKVQSFDKPVALNVYDSSYCALEAAGKLWCWGGSFNSILGTGAGIRLKPVEIPLP